MTPKEKKLVDAGNRYADADREMRKVSVQGGDMGDRRSSRDRHDKAYADLVEAAKDMPGGGK